MKHILFLLAITTSLFALGCSRKNCPCPPWVDNNNQLRPCYDFVDGNYAGEIRLYTSDDSTVHSFASVSAVIDDSNHLSITLSPAIMLADSPINHQLLGIEGKVGSLHDFYGYVKLDTNVNIPIVAVGINIPCNSDTLSCNKLEEDELYPNSTTQEILIHFTLPTTIGSDSISAINCWLHKL
jgi:hypothetical protein